MITGFATEEEQEAAEAAWPPTISQFANALQIWSVCQNRPTTVDEAVMMFNVEPALIRQAVEHHPWMELVAADGREFIQHEGS